jgi:hypothetical protein
MSKNIFYMFRHAREGGHPIFFSLSQRQGICSWKKVIGFISLQINPMALFMRALQMTLHEGRRSIVKGLLRGLQKNMGLRSLFIAKNIQRRPRQSNERSRLKNGIENGRFIGLNSLIRSGKTCSRSSYKKTNGMPAFAGMTVGEGVER